MDNYNEIAEMVSRCIGKDITTWYGSNTLQIHPFSNESELIETAEKLVNADTGLRWIEGEERQIWRGDDPDEMLDNITLNLRYLDQDYILMLFFDGEVHIEMLK